MTNFFNGKKTYFAAGAGVLAVLAYLFGLIDEPTLNSLLGILGFAGLAALRAGVSKVK